MGLRKISITIYEPTEADIRHVLGMDRRVVCEADSRPVMDHVIEVHTSATDAADVQLDVVVNRYPF